MAIRAVVFDVGGVLERVGDADVWLGAWRTRLGIEPDDFEVRFAQVDPRGLVGTGDITEGEYRQRCLEAFGMSEYDADVFIADMWDWYCGELDTELVEFARGLRPAYRTAILSNSADGARREEQRRYGFEQLVDMIIYSHEVGVAKPDHRIYQLACERLSVLPIEMVFLDDTVVAVESARSFGIHAVLHKSTPQSVAAINALLAVDAA